MTMVSKYPLNDKIKTRVFELFLDTLAGIKTGKEVENFISEFLSPTEKIMLAKRLSIAILLNKNYEVREICKILKVSKNTIVKVNQFIKHKQGYLYNLTQEINRDNKIKEFWEEVGFNIEKSAIPLSVGNWSAKRKLIEKNHYDKIQKRPF